MLTRRALCLSLAPAAAIGCAAAGPEAVRLLGLPVLSDIGFALAVIFGYRLFSER